MKVRDDNWWRVNDLAITTIAQWLADRWGYEHVPQKCVDDAAEAVRFLEAVGLTISRGGQP